MANMIVGGVTVSISTTTPPSRNTVEYGDYSPAFDGTDRGVIVGRKRVWTVTTTPMLQADADTLEAAILATPPVSVSGTITGSISARGVITGYTYVAVRSGYMVVMTFTLTLV